MKGKKKRGEYIDLNDFSVRKVFNFRQIPNGLLEVKITVTEPPDISKELPPIQNPMKGSDSFGPQDALNVH